MLAILGGEMKPLALKELDMKGVTVGLGQPAPLLPHLRHLRNLKMASFVAQAVYTSEDEYLAWELARGKAIGILSM